MDWMFFIKLVAWLMIIVTFSWFIKRYVFDAGQDVTGPVETLAPAILPQRLYSLFSRRKLKAR